MSTPETTTRRNAFALLLVAVGLTALIGVGLLLQEYAPGNMGTGASRICTREPQRSNVPGQSRVMNWN